MANKLSIIIPIFNESKTIVQLLDAVANFKLASGLKKEMILVESNSSDGTRELVQKYIESKKGSDVEMKLILQEKARGKGNAAREGLENVSGDIVLIQDGDLEYDVADYDTVLEPILSGHADFVLGSRHLSAGSWKIRKFEESPFKTFIMNLGGTLFHAFFNLTYQVTLTDPTTMYKVFRTECIKGVPFESNRFDFDFELVAKLIRLGYIPYEVPVSYRSRGFAAGKKVSILRDPWTYVFAILKFRIKKIRRLSRKEIEMKRQQSLA